MGRARLIFLPGISLLLHKTAVLQCKAKTFKPQHEGTTPQGYYGM